MPAPRPGPPPPPTAGALSLFGTDGIRDRAGVGRLAPEVVERAGRALARLAREGRRAGAGRVRALVGEDPRPSSPSLAARLARALAAEGVEVGRLGVCPTPAVAWLVATGDLDLGLMVSASHNPASDNGIKPFLRGGRKLTVEEEEAVERWAGEAAVPLGAPARAAPRQGPATAPAVTPREGEPWEGEPEERDPGERAGGRVEDAEEGVERYVAATTQALGGAGALEGRTVVVDLAAGAMTRTAPRILSGLGARVVALHPAGSRPINEACGTQHPEAWLAARSRLPGVVGLAFDGDGDRVLVADEEGGLLDGDDLLAILAEEAAAAGGVPGGRVVGTVMANLGLEERLARIGVALERTAVGDRHVARRMQEVGAALGGEPSGHLVLERDGALIGDALVSGVRALLAARRRGARLADLRRLTARRPQVLRSVTLPERRPLESMPGLVRAIQAAERELEGTGRLVVRWSGTEPLLRIMAQGREAGPVERAVALVEAEARRLQEAANGSPDGAAATAPGPRGVPPR